jgi:hypothetical protein
MIQAGTRRVSLLAALSNLQISDRTLWTDGFDSRTAAEYRELATRVPLRLLGAVTPVWYRRFIDKLSERERESFLKNSILSHELWGRTEGIAVVFRSILESASGVRVPVRVEAPGAKTVPIPEQLHTRLGSTYSTLGADFTLGKQVRCRSNELHIYAGPISLNTLEVLQQSEWAEGLNAGNKARMLGELVVPYYIKPFVHYVLDTRGFVLGTSRLGTERVGREYGKRVSS